MEDSREQIRNRLDVQRSLLDTLASDRGGDLPERVHTKPAPQQVLKAPYWLIDYLTGTTLTLTTDWDTGFFDAGTLSIIQFGKPTALGELEWHLVDNNANSSRCRLFFYSPAPFDATIRIHADTWGAVQYKTNGGSHTHITGNTSFTMSVREGLNVLQVSIGNGACRLMVLVDKLLAGHARWIDPFDASTLSEEARSFSDSGGGLGSTPPIP